MRDLKRRGLAIFLVSIMLLAAAAGSGLAANETPAIDTETSNTATTSELQSGTDLTGFNANADNSTIVGLNGENGTDSPKIEISRNDSDTVVYENDSLENVSRQAGGTLWNGSFSHDELADLEVAIDENVTMDLRAEDGSNESNQTTIQFGLNNTDERTVQNLDDTDADPDTDDAPVETSELSDSLTKVTSFDIHTLEFSDLDVDDRAVAGDETDVFLVFSNGTVDDHASDAIPDDVEDEDAMYGFTLVVSADDGPTQPIRVYHEEVPDGVDEDDDTYGIYKDDIGGENGVEINLGDEYEDAEEVSVTGRLNAGKIDRTLHWVATTGTWQAVFGFLSFDLGGVLAGGLPTLAIGALAVRRRRLAG